MQHLDTHDYVTMHCGISLILIQNELPKNSSDEKNTPVIFLSV